MVLKISTLKRVTVILVGLVMIAVALWSAAYMASRAGFLITLLLSSGGAGLLAGCITGIMNHRKLKAELYYR